MDCEIIYEATGEVTPMENGIKHSSSTDENASRQTMEKNGSKQLLFNDGSTGEYLMNFSLLKYLVFSILVFIQMMQLWSLFSITVMEIKQAW